MRMKEADLAILAEVVLEKMDGNDRFPEPLPPLSALADALAAYRQALTAGHFGGKPNTVSKDQIRGKLEKTLDRLAIYVEQVADGNPEFIMDAGFLPAKSKGPTIPSIKATGLIVEHGPVGSGLIKLRVDPYKAARMYRFQYRELGTDAWTEHIVSKSYIELSDLKKFQNYEFRVAYLSADPNFIYSDIIIAYPA